MRAPRHAAHPRVPLHARRRTFAEGLHLQSLLRLQVLTIYVVDPGGQALSRGSDGRLETRGGWGLRARGAQVAVTYMPAPAMVLYAQLATSAMAAVALHHLGLVETDALDTEKVRARLFAS